MTPIRIQTMKLYRATDARVLPVELAVVHWTASPPTGPGVADEARIRRWLADDTRQTSTHFVILRDGAVLQAADLTERTWHAGGSAWRGAGQVNAKSIGIDLENVGPVGEREGMLVDAYGGRYHGSPPVLGHEPYTGPQLASMMDLARHLARELPVLRDQTRWVAHSAIRPGKLDPGPLFPWSALAAALQARP